MSTFESTSDERDSTACSDEEFEFITIPKEVKMTAFAVVSRTKKKVWTCKKHTRNCWVHTGHPTSFPKPASAPPNSPSSTKKLPSSH